MRSVLWTIVGAVAGLAATYAVWRWFVVPSSQGFSVEAYTLRDMLALLGLNRLHTPWLLYGLGTAGGAFVGWILTWKSTASRS